MYTILVIDGEPTQSEGLCSMLRDKLSYHTINVSDGHEANYYLKSDQAPKPDLILFDVSQTADPRTTIASLKAVAPYVPIITLVTYGDYDTALTTMSAGALDFFTKPVAKERLAITLRNTLRLSQAYREAEELKHEQIRTAYPTITTSCIPSFSLIDRNGEVRRMDQLEADAIQFAIHRYNGRMAEVARRLGIGRSTLYRKLNDMNAQPSGAV